jgi:hypothetical protein
LFSFASYVIYVSLGYIGISHQSNWLISRGKASHVLNCEDGGGDVGDFRHFPVIITVIIIHTFWDPSGNLT